MTPYLESRPRPAPAANADRAAGADLKVRTSNVDAAVARAISLVAAGDAVAGAQVVADALASAPAGNAGWLIPIELFLGV